MKETLYSLYRFLSPRFQTIHLDYRVQAKPRIHTHLKKIIEEEAESYRDLLHEFCNYSEVFSKILDHKNEADTYQPAWNNRFLPGLDMIALYGMIAHYKPSHYFEIGSGNSTKMAHKAIRDLGLNTQIVSMDPFPRAEIDELTHEIIRMPFEDIPDYDFIIHSLEENDILFIDNSHRVLPNSDAMVVFLEILPRLKKGVIVQLHDIYLPYDYPQFMCDRYYNEQYFLAAMVMANPKKYKPLLPNFYISETLELAGILQPVWEKMTCPVERHGGSFWLRIED